MASENLRIDGLRLRLRLIGARRLAGARRRVVRLLVVRFLGIFLAPLFFRVVLREDRFFAVFFRVLRFGLFFFGLSTLSFIFQSPGA